MSGRLAGRAFVVTGASRGIGRSIALRLAAEGASLVVTAERSDEDRLATLSAAVPGVIPLAADLEDGGAAARLVGRCLASYGRIDGLVSNAARHFPGAVADISIADWDRALRVNLSATMLLAQAALPHLVAAARGAIVSIASQRAFASGHGEAAYESAKGALLALTRSLAVDYGPKGIRTNCVSPGLILSERAREWLEGDPRRGRAMAAATPLRRPGEPEEVAAVVAFLLSDDASYINGAIIPVDGGALAGLPENAALALAGAS